MASPQTAQISRRFRTIAAHCESNVFRGAGWAELQVHLPAFANADDREEMRQNLFRIGSAIHRPFCQTDCGFDAIALKISSDDQETLEALSYARQSFQISDR